MNGTQINYLNIGLIALSLGLAFLLPFELFLFSYAVLGPLHYLTEIGWLHKKQYFTKNKTDFITLIVLSLIYVILFFLISFFYSKFSSEEGLMQLKSWFGKDYLAKVNAYNYWQPTVILAGFAVAIAMVFTKSFLTRIGVILFAIAIGHSINGDTGSANYLILVGILVPTLVHVFLFTAIFMLFGARKSKSKSGYLSVGLLMVGGAVCFLVSENVVSDGLTSLSAAQDIYSSSGFMGVNGSIFKYVTGEAGTEQSIFFSGLGIQIQRFIAFAYTYHYLNWFSKTSIIGWHKIPKKNLAVALGLWALSVGIYFYDYKIGIYALLLLSVLHVFLEFPLNIKSFVGLFQSNSK